MAANELSRWTSWFYVQKPCYFKSVILWVSLLCALSTHATAETKVFAELDRSDADIGEPVTLTITMNQSPDKDLIVPNVDGLVIDSVGTSQSMNIMNGSVSRELIYSFQVTASRAGEFTIPSISVTVDGNQIQTLPLKLRVGGSSAPNQGQPPTGQSPDTKAQASGRSDLIFIERELSSGPYFEGGQILSKVKIFSRTRMNIVPERESQPDWRIVTKPDQRQYDLERGGYTYRVIELTEVLIPLKSGTFEVPSYAARITYAEPSRRGTRPRSVWDLFQNGLDMGREVTRRFSSSSEPSKIKIEALPPAPASLPPPVDAVGRFTLDAAVTASSLKVGETLTLTLTLKGRGPLDRLEELKISSVGLPARIYVDKPNLKEEIDDQGLSSTRTIKAAVVPSSAGVLELAPISFSVFDPESKSWVPLSASIPKIEVVSNSSESKASSAQPGTAGTSDASDASDSSGEKSKEIQSRGQTVIKPSDFPALKTETATMRPPLFTVYKILQFSLGAAVILVSLLLSVRLWSVLRTRHQDHVTSMTQIEKIRRFMTQDQSKNLEFFFYELFKEVTGEDIHIKALTSFDLQKAFNTFPRDFSRELKAQTDAWEFERLSDKTFTEQESTAKLHQVKSKLHASLTSSDSVPVTDRPGMSS